MLSPFWDTARRQLIVSEISGQRVGPVFKVHNTYKQYLVLVYTTLNTVYRIRARFDMPNIKYYFIYIHQTGR